MDINNIKQHVTHFSLELPEKTVQEQEVVVGGQITAIIPPVDAERPFFIVLLDDKVGALHVYVSETMMVHFAERITVGQYAFFEGAVSILRHLKFNKVETEAVVYAYGMKDITILEEAH